MTPEETQQLIAAETGQPYEAPRQRERKKISHVRLGINIPFKISLRHLDDILQVRSLTAVAGATVSYIEWEGVVQRTYEFVAVMIPTDWLNDMNWQVKLVDVCIPATGYLAVLYRELNQQSAGALTPLQTPEMDDPRLTKMRNALFARDTEMRPQAPAPQPIASLRASKRSGLFSALEAEAKAPSELSAVERQAIASATGITI